MDMHGRFYDHDGQPLVGWFETYVQGRRGMSSYKWMTLILLTKMLWNPSTAGECCSYQRHFALKVRIHMERASGKTLASPRP